MIGLGACERQNLHDRSQGNASTAVEVATRVSGIIILPGQDFPALRGLTLDVGLAGLPLGVQRIEFLL